MPGDAIPANNMKYAVFFLKMAAAYDRLGDSETAIICIKEAQKSDRGIHIPLSLKKYIY